MKDLRKLVLGWSAALLLLPSIAIADEPESLTIADIVASSGGEFDANKGDYDLLLNALIAADLVAPFTDPEADFTVLAPNDAAFVRLARDLGYEGQDEGEAFNAIVLALTDIGDGDPIPVLSSVLLYHVSPGAKGAEELLDGGPIETLLEGAAIVGKGRVLIDADPDFLNPKLIEPVDIAASNGVIQTINRVLLPVDLDNGFPGVGTITSLVAQSGGVFDENSGDFDILLTAVLTAGLDGALADETASLTVFAPTDKAFFNLARVFGYAGPYDEGAAFQAIVDALTVLGEGDPIGPLTNVLLYHVAPEALSLNTVLLSDAVTTLLEEAVVKPTGFSLADADPGVRNPRLIVGSGDLRADNGLIHPIDGVLLPLRVSPEKKIGQSSE